MESFYNYQDEEYGGIDVRAEAQRFEERLRAEVPFFIDITLIDEIYEYYFLNQQPEKALQLIDYALTQYPTSADLYYKKSCLQYAMERFMDAAVEIDNALELKGQDGDYLTQKARILGMLEQHESAIKLLLEAVALGADEAEAYYQLGIISRKAERYNDAIQYFTQALTLEPFFEEAMHEVVQCFDFVHEPEKGIEFCESFINRYPYHAVAWYNLGLLQYASGLFESALVSFEYVMIIDSSFTMGYFSQGNCYMELQKYEEALRAFFNFIQHEPKDFPTLLNIAECYENLELYGRSRFYYLKAAELVPENPDVWSGLAGVLEAEGRWYDALPYYRRAIEVNAEHYDAWFGAAVCEYELGNDTAAFEALRMAINLCPDDLTLWEEWAERLENDNRTDEAVDLLFEGLRTNRDAVELMYRFSAYAFKVGRSREAFVALENALMRAFDKHVLLYRYCPQIAGLRPIQELIEQYRPR